MAIIFLFYKKIIHSQTIPWVAFFRVEQKLPQREHRIIGNNSPNEGTSSQPASNGTVVAKLCYFNRPTRLLVTQATFRSHVSFFRQTARP